MGNRVLIPAACALLAALCLHACAGRQLTERQKLERHIRTIQDNNARACVVGCLAFEGDSNVELINFQEYFSEPACNYSYRGSTTKKLMERRGRMESLKPSAIVVLVGGNDLLSGIRIDDINRNYIALITYYKSISSKVYCISNLPVAPDICIKNSTLQQLNTRLQQTCARLGAVYVPVYPHLMKNGGLNPEYARDPVHLNRAGQDVLIGVLKKYLKK